MTTSIVIVGSGPAGWSAAIYAARAGLAPILMTGDSPGGQLMLTTEVENFPGFPDGIMGSELLDKLRQQAEKFGTMVVEAAVIRIEPQGTKHLVVTTQGDYLARAVVITTGAEARWLDVPGEKELIGRGVSACAVCDAAFFRNKEVVVVGGGDAAMEDALALSRFCDSVKIIHRRDSFRASKVMVDKVKQKPNIAVVWNTQVLQILGEKMVDAIETKNTITGEVKQVSTQGVFVAIGHQPETGFLKGLIELDDNGYIKTGEGEYPSMTNVKGIFAAGDCMDTHYRQASTAAGLGVMAGLDAQRYLERVEAE